MKSAYAILDLQFGSTGKGLLAGYLALTRQPDTAVCAFGPNAGHTFVDKEDKTHMHTMLPMGALSPKIRRVLIGPGAVIDVAAMLNEADALRAQGQNFELAIHENAVVVTQRHRDMEGRRVGTVKTGSTRKGTGAALAEKIWREDVTARDMLKWTPLEGNVVSVAEYNDLMDEADVLQIEGAQGFSLSHHHGFYPYVTSKDCTIWGLLSDCAVPARFTRPGLQVYGTCRTYPIRVNNREFSSGPCYHDQQEIKWEDIGVPPELTTVTKLERRVFTFSVEQITQAIRMNGVDGVFLNFCNYPPIMNKFSPEVAITQAGSKVMWRGWGPAFRNVDATWSA